MFPSLMKPGRRDLAKAGLGGLLAASLPVSLPFGALARAVEDPNDPWAEARAIRARIRPPVFPRANRFGPEQFGGRADGVTDNTEAFRRAIDAASKAPGGGRVVVEGTADGTVWLTGAIHLKSNVELHVSRESTIRFRTEPEAYFPAILTRYEGTEFMGISPFIYAYGCENIAITGHGILDGQASRENWWRQKRVADGQESDNGRLRRWAEEGKPVAERVFGPEATIRPQFIQPYRCRNVLISDLTILRSPMWEVHPVECENVTVRRLTISSHGPNNDGCDPESCRDVLIEDCVFDTGDDCIAIKSGRNADGRRLGKPTENLIVSGCTMLDGHGGVTLGSEISGGVRNVFVENCRMDSPRLNTAIRFKNNAARGGTLTNIHVRDVTVGQVAHAAITIDYNYAEGANGRFTPVFDGLTIERMTVGRCERVLDLQGFETAPIRNIALKDCDFVRAAELDIIEHVEGLTYANVRRNAQAVTGPAPGGHGNAADRSG
ncbi:glycoside hydrolase family 28 protein [Brevundimonas goettingensis]|uniref:Glycoside hydrolase family 28 protein n=1 Tax=Brevundimonas goettingensis TaxID=2774190 RepID=A0A975GVX2_9CAUL|nr:glycoside hydrolase family 28 protein [Brevundimonas goettingensis]QTC91917.1 glycoside hydrolase family 28 protein [Brevundimonas goettingensis]